MDGRRTTLGPMPASLFNASNVATGGGMMGKLSRVSMGAARVATGIAGGGAPKTRASIAGFSGASGGAIGGHGGVPAPQSRVSIAGGVAAAARRSSAGIRGSQADPRPVQTAAFVQEMRETLARFLMENKYDQDITMKLLSSPTNADVEKMFVFLMKAFDPAYKVKEKLDKDLPDIFKLLKYDPLLQCSLHGETERP